MRDGIEVYRLRPSPSDASVTTKEIIGLSPTAGQHAVAQSAASRVFTNIPTLIIPPMVMSLLERRGAFTGKHGKLGATITQLTLSE